MTQPIALLVPAAAAAAAAAVIKWWAGLGWLHLSKKKMAGVCVCVCGQPFYGLQLTYISSYNKPLAIYIS